MILIIYTDGDSGIKSPSDGLQCKKFLNDYEYAFLIGENEINKFSEHWYLNKFNLSKIVWNCLNYMIPDVIHALENGNEDIFKNDNYYIRTVKECNFYLI
jgi:hypothetical protein